MNRNILIAAAVIIILIAFAAIFMGEKSSPPAKIGNELSSLPTAVISSFPSASVSVTISPSALGMENTTELKIEDLKVGTGEEAKSGNRVSVNYKGTLTNGTQFDSSYDRGQPFSFDLGAGDVISGWDEGVVGMKVGGKRKLVIPPDMAYGARALPGIPANSTLVFEVELLKVE